MPPILTRAELAEEARWRALATHEVRRCTAVEERLAYLRGLADHVISAHAAWLALERADPPLPVAASRAKERLVERGLMLAEAVRAADHP